MTERKNDAAQVSDQQQDVLEFIELMRGATETEKAQVKGILIGMKMSKEAQPA